MSRLGTFLYKATHYEFWPWYLMFLPVLPVYFFGVLRTRKLLYFTAANPSIDMGGFFGEKKDEIMDLIPDDYKVKGIHVTSKLSLNEVSNLLNTASLNFPVVLKPNVGERGKGVVIVHSEEDIVFYSLEEQDFLIQEYVNSELELGVLFSRLPNETIGQVSSITQKAFLTVIGDGVSTVGQLLKSKPRNSIYSSLVRKEFPDRYAYIPGDGEIYIVHKIGNHVKGTRFIDANVHISDTLSEVFTKISDALDGFYYGRYDLKVPSYSDLEAGQNIKIFELNGVSSEPGDLYDQKNVLGAYSILAKHWLRIVQVSHQNIKKGVKTTPLSVFLRKVLNHFFG